MERKRILQPGISESQSTALQRDVKLCVVLPGQRERRENAETICLPQPPQGTLPRTERNGSLGL